MISQKYVESKVRVMVFLMCLIRNRGLVTTPVLTTLFFSVAHNRTKWQLNAGGHIYCVSITHGSPSSCHLHPNRTHPGPDKKGFVGSDATLGAAGLKTRIRSAVIRKFPLTNTHNYRN